MSWRDLSVVKVGGSLVADADRLKSLLTSLANGAEGPVVIVPGGGPFADAVRSAQAALGFDDRLAHRLALDAMGHMAEVFCAIEPRLALAPRAYDVGAALAEHRAAIWTAAELRGGHPSIPENWDVTSDSLALWLATELAAARCILVKSAPCPVDADAAELAQHGIVDQAFPSFARAFDGEIVIRSAGGDCVFRQSTSRSSSNSAPHPEVRGEAEPRRSPPGCAAGSGRLLRGGFAAPQDEGVDGPGGQFHHSIQGSAA